MSINDPYASPAARKPRLRILNNGRPVGGALSFHVENNAYFQADVFSASFAFNVDPDFGVNWWGSQDTLSLDIQASLDGGDSWVSLLLGAADHLQVHLERGTIQVDGRDLTARLIDAKTQETFQNKTASQIVETLAARHGMTADLTPTSTLVGRYYGSDFEITGAGEHTRSTTHWNLLCSLAQKERYDVFVTGRTLHFHPTTPPTSNPYAVVWDKAGPWSNAEWITTERSMSFSKDITVEVRSWNSKHERAITRTAGPSNVSPDRKFSYVFANLTDAEALNMANTIRAGLSAHERLISFQVPGDLLLNPRHILHLQGTGSPFDEIYYTDSVTRTLSWDSGYTMTARGKSLPAIDTPS